MTAVQENRLSIRSTYREKKEFAGFFCRFLIAPWRGCLVEKRPPRPVFPGSPGQWALD